MTIQEIYSKINSLSSLSPSEEVNHLFSALVKKSLENHIQADLNKEEINQLQILASRAEFELEKFWTEKIILGENNLSDFPYYKNYIDLTKLELHSLQGCSEHKVHKLLFAGSGPLPLTAIVLATEHNIKSTIIDNDKEAIVLSRMLLKRLNLLSKIEVIEADATTFNKYNEFSVIYIAALAGAKDSIKAKIFNQIKLTGNKGTHIIARSSWGNRKLLYKPLSKNIFEIFKPLIQVNPFNEIVNSIVIFKITDKVIIKKADLNDLERIKEFMLKIIKDDFGYSFNPEWHKDIEEIEKYYLNNQNSNLFYAEEDGNIIGTIAARPYDKNFPEFSKKYNAKNTLSIWRHYIVNNKRGKGIGTKLLKHIEKDAKKNGFKYIYLHTQKTIPGSLEYWEAKGYKKTIDKNDELKTVHLEKILFI